MPRSSRLPFWKTAQVCAAPTWDLRGGRKSRDCFRGTLWLTIAAQIRRTQSYHALEPEPPVMASNTDMPCGVDLSECGLRRRNHCSSGGCDERFHCIAFRSKEQTQGTAIANDATPAPDQVRRL